MDVSALSVSELKNILFEQGNDISDSSFLKALAEDPRSGVRRLYARFMARRQKYEEEKLRVSRLYEYEDKCTAEGCRFIAGVDEAGRGPLAGPVVAAAVILPGKLYLPGLNDSKKVSAAGRESLFEKIKVMALDWATGIATVEEILAINIYHASLLAMRRAVCNLKQQPDMVLVDGAKQLDLMYSQLALVKGDTLSASIAAASIMAKVTRDSMMLQYHRLYPQYGFDRHKGYPTAFHLQALARFGPCPVHRADFKPVKEFCDIINNKPDN